MWSTDVMNTLSPRMMRLGSCPNWHDARVAHALPMRLNCVVVVVTVSAGTINAVNNVVAKSAACVMRDGELKDVVGRTAERGSVSAYVDESNATGGDDGMMDERASDESKLVSAALSSLASSRKES